MSYFFCVSKMFFFCVFEIISRDPSRSQLNLRTNSLISMKPLLGKINLTSQNTSDKPLAVDNLSGFM